MTRALVFVIAIGMVACTQRAGPKETPEKILNARRVRLDVEQGGENIVVKGNELRLNLETREMKLKGDASVTMDGPVHLRADAAEIALTKSFEIIELKGEVRAYVGNKKQDTVDGKLSHP